MSALQNIKDAAESIRSFTESTKDFFTAMSKITHFIGHPAESALILWNGLVEYSLPIFLLICLLSILAYLIGNKKGKKFATGSFLAYFLIQLINAGLR